MRKDYQRLSVDELRLEIRRRFGDQTDAIFQDKEKLWEAVSQDDGLLDAYFDRISRGN